MTQVTKPQIVRIEQLEKVDPPIVHCPICGKPSLKMVKGNGQINPCKHLVFILSDIASDFEYKSPEFDQKLSRNFNCSKISIGKVKNSLRKLGYDNKLLAFQITYGGMACGPNSCTELVAFEYTKV